METLEQLIERFLTPSRESGDGSGYSYGYGHASGEGNCDGSGDGAGSCDGSGYGVGSGESLCVDKFNGYGCGSDSGDGNSDGSGDSSICDGGILSFNGHKTYTIDNIQTLIYQVRGNYARGAIICDDLTLNPCFVARFGDFYGHGDTIHEAFEAAKTKAMERMPEDERIDLFVREHPDIDKEYDDLFKWHHILTGSCEFGRRQWCERHGYKPTDSITIRTFLDKTRNDYGSAVIAKVRERYRLNCS